MLTQPTYPASVRGLIIKPISAKEQKPYIELVDRISSVVGLKDYTDDPKKCAKVIGYERELNSLIYKLYSLTPEEIGTIENSLGVNNEQKVEQK